MKKILLLLAFCSSALIGSAQDFGKTLVTGSIGYSSSGSETDFNAGSAYANENPKRHSFNITPQVGFFVSPRWAVGASIGYTSEKSENVNYNSGVIYEATYLTSKSHTFTVGPFVRYYQPVSEKAAFFGQAMVGYQFNKLESEYIINSSNTTSTNEQTYNGVIANLMPGFVFFPSNKIGLELTLGSIGYQRTKQEQEDSDYAYIEKSFDIGFGLENVNIGVSLYLGRTASE